MAIPSHAALLVVAGSLRTWGFLTPGVLPSGATLTRASTGWYFNSSPALASASTDAGRWTYDPTTAALLGLLVEPAATNSIRNASAGGAVAGSPGTLPTNWTASTTTGLTRTLALASEGGISALDVGYAGTITGSSFAIAFESSVAVAAAVGQTWAGSFYARLLSGSFAGIVAGANGIRIDIDEVDAGGVPIPATTSPAPINGMTGAALNTQRWAVTRTLTQATAAFVRVRLFIGWLSGSAIDFNIRIGLPQIVQAAAPSSPIVTTSAAVARAADVLSLAVPNGTYSVVITRASGVTFVAGAVVSGGAYVVPTDPSPLQRVDMVRTA